MLDQLWKFVTDSPKSISIPSVIALFAPVIALFTWAIRRYSKRKTRIDMDVFEVITDSALILPKLFGTENDESPLADHRITYQPRDPKRDTQIELKAALSAKRYLLITAPTGHGKTREAGELAQTMMLEGWQYCVSKQAGWMCRKHCQKRSKTACTF